MKVKDKNAFKMHSKILLILIFGEVISVLLKNLFLIFILAFFIILFLIGLYNTTQKTADEIMAEYRKKKENKKNKK